MRTEYDIPLIPAYVTVHTGDPDGEGENYILPFPEYLKAVAAVSLPPDMPYEATCAVMYAQVTRALNRITEKKYRRQGYAFDLTDDPVTDLPFVYGSASFVNQGRIADEIFNEFIATDYGFWPIDAEICYEGTRCRGISVEGSIEMAENGRSCHEILEYYFGKEIGIIKNVSVKGLGDSFLMDYPLRSGDEGAEVSGLQIALNNVAANFGGIPYIEYVDGLYGEETALAVKAFQRQFDLTVSGSLDKGTYYRLLYVLDSIYRLRGLVLEGRKLEGIPTVLRGELSYGAVGNQVKLLQHYLSFVSAFVSTVPSADVVGVYGERTYRAVTAFQSMFGFEPDGIVSEEVWRVLLDVYEGLYSSLPNGAFAKSAIPYGGNMLLLGSVEREVVFLQEYLRKVAEVYRELPKITAFGEFDEETESAVKAFQQIFGIKASGVVTSTTWDAIAGVYNAIIAGERSA